MKPDTYLLTDWAFQFTRSHLSMTTRNTGTCLTNYELTRYYTRIRQQILATTLKTSSDKELMTV